MPESCNITFSPYFALVDLPDHEVVAAHRYLVSDQTFISDTGETVRFIARPFIAPENRSFKSPDLPDLVAGHKYGVFRDCSTQDTIAGGACPPIGACLYPAIDCCLELLEGECSTSNGEWQGVGTRCPDGPECTKHPCCIRGSSGLCFLLPLPVCELIDGLPRPEQEQCSTNSCVGACCIHFGVRDSILCIPLTTDWDCTHPVEAGLIDEPRKGSFFIPIWMGPGTCCPGQANCPNDNFIDCPTVLPCCPADGVSDLDCIAIEPETCVEQGGGVGTTNPDCAFSVGVCDGACCITELNPFGKIIGGHCFDGDQSECIDAGFGPLHDWSWLGPGTNCVDNAGDCGICCVYNSQTDGFECVEDLTQVECVAQCGRAYGPGAECDICENVERACCVPVDHGPGAIEPPDFGEKPGPITGPAEHPFCQGPFECESVNSRAECHSLEGLGQRGRYHPCVTCASPVCITMGGACCTPLAGKPPDGDTVCTCVDKTRVDCINGGGCFYGEGTACCTPFGGGVPNEDRVCCVFCPDFEGPDFECGPYC